MPAAQPSSSFLGPIFLAFALSCGTPVLTLARFQAASDAPDPAADTSITEPPSREPDPRIDEETGRDRSNYPTSPLFDFRHMKLAIEFPNMDLAVFSAVETLIVESVGRARPTLRLDAGRGIEVESVRVKGRTVRTRRDESNLWIDFAVPIEPGQTAEVIVRYTCDFRSNKGVGLTWSKPNPDGAGPTQKSVQIHSQGEAEENRRWFLCHDSPNEKLTTELLVTLDAGYDLCSNGRLVSKDAADPEREVGPTCLLDGRPVDPTPSVVKTTHHWLQDKPHASYLVTLVIGKFGIVDINPSASWIAAASGAPGVSVRPNLPMCVWTMRGTEDDVASIFANTPAMVAFYEARFLQPYPWDKYDQLICRDFLWGGMENTSATTLYTAASRGGRGDQDDLISHELAHQWFGDLVTCKSWEHLWLNEGWASIAESLWAEQDANLRELIPQESTRDGRTSGVNTLDDHLPFFIGVAPPSEAGRRAYQKSILGFMRSQRNQNRSSAPQYPALASNRYSNAGEPIAKADDVYAKGALVLHMLRVNLGDELFFKGTALYLDRMKFKSVETDDFRRALEDTCGRSFERFFDQWVKRPGLPRLEVDLSIGPDEAGGQHVLTVSVEQSQKIDRFNPAYEFTLPVLLRFDDGTHRYVHMDIDQRTVVATFSVPGIPSQVSIDPNLTVLAGTTVRKPLALWINELSGGATLAAQVQAAEAVLALGGASGTLVVESRLLDPATDPTLRSCLTDLLDEHHSRVSAVPGRSFTTLP